MNSKGFTLLELVITIVILGIGVGAFAILLNTVAENSIDPLLRQQAHAVARSYLEEILIKSFCDPDFDPDGDGLTECSDLAVGVGCTESACAASSTNTCGGPFEASGGEGTTRAIFDDVCDYTNLPDNQVRDQTGALIAELSDYTVTVSIIDNGANLNGLLGTSGQSLRIDVNVTRAPNVDITLTGYRANF